MSKHIKGLKPALREKKRYIAYQVFSEHQPTQTETTQAITQELLTFLGTQGYAHAGIQLLPETPTTGIIRSAHTHTTHTITALSLITQINKNPTHIQPLSTSGILAKARNTLKRRTI